MTTLSKVDLEISLANCDTNSYSIQAPYMIYVEILETEESKEETVATELGMENPIRQVRYCCG